MMYWFDESSVQPNSNPDLQSAFLTRKKAYVEKSVRRQDQLSQQKEGKKQVQTNRKFSADGKFSRPAAEKVSKQTRPPKNTTKESKGGGKSKSK